MSTRGRAVCDVDSMVAEKPLGRSVGMAINPVEAARGRGATDPRPNTGTRAAPAPRRVLLGDDQRADAGLATAPPTPTA